MRYLHFTVAADGFAGHMAESEEKAGLAYRQFQTHKKECMQALEQSEMEIIRWLEVSG
jgi:hypothetical protein